MPNSIKSFSGDSVKGRNYSDLNLRDLKKYDGISQTIVALGILSVLVGITGLLVTGNLLFFIAIGVGLLISCVAAVVKECNDRSGSVLNEEYSDLLSSSSDVLPLTDDESIHSELSVKTKESEFKPFDDLPLFDETTPKTDTDSSFLSSVVTAEEKERFSYPAVRQYFKSHFLDLPGKSPEGVRRFYCGGRSFSDRVFLFFGKSSLENPIIDISRISSIALITATENQESSSGLSKSLNKILGKTQTPLLSYGDIRVTKRKNSKNHPGKEGLPWNLSIYVRDPDPSIHAIQESFDLSIKSFKTVFEYLRNNRVEYCQINLFNSAPEDPEKREVWRSMRELALLRACVEWIAELGDPPDGLRIGVVDNEELPLNRCFD